MPTTNLIDLEKLKELVNFYDLALYFKEDKIKVSYNSVMFCCPFHGESNPSFSYHIEKKFGYCFSCSTNCNCFTYVQHKLNCSFKEALHFLVKFCKVEGYDLSIDLKQGQDYKKDIGIINKFAGKEKLNTFQEVSEKDLEVMKDFRIDYFDKLGFTKETQDYFEVGFDAQKKRMVLPIRNESNELIGVTGRTIEKDFKEKKIQKWLHYKGSQLTTTFYNINKALQPAKEKGSIIIVEGPKDVMWLYQNGFPNVVALLRNDFSQAQKVILLKNFYTVYLMLDGDQGGIAGKASILEKIKGYFNIFDVQLPQGKDPDDLTKEQLQDLIKNAIKIN